MKTRRIVLDALFTAVALTLFLVELQIPNPVPVAGIKLGLANLVTVVAMVLLSPLDALAILAVRILLGSLFSGNMMALLYSAAGGALCYVVMLLLRGVVTARQIWALSAVGGIAHNVGQMAAAIAVTRTPALIVYLPVLLIGGTVAGLFTGLAAQFLIARLRPLLPRFRPTQTTNRGEKKNHEESETS